MAKLRANNYRCAVSDLPYWNDDAPTSFGPSIPSVDRIDPLGDYSDANTRVVLLGVNGLRGQGSDLDMVRIATAVVARVRRDHRAARSLERPSSAGEAA